MRPTIALTLLLAACIGGDAEDSADDTDTSDTLTETLENTGYACIDDDEDDNHDSAQVSVMLDDCLSGCAYDLVASCEASTDGDTVSVTASGTYTVPTGPEVNCPGVCVELSASCEADGVAKGSFALEYAGESVGFAGPVTEESCTGP